MCVGGKKEKEERNLKGKNRRHRYGRKRWLGLERGGQCADLFPSVKVDHIKAPHHGFVARTWHERTLFHLQCEAECWSSFSPPSDDYATDGGLDHFKSLNTNTTLFDIRHFTLTHNDTKLQNHFLWSQLERTGSSKKKNTAVSHLRLTDR